MSETPKEMRKRPAKSPKALPDTTTPTSRRDDGSLPAEAKQALQELLHQPSQANIEKFLVRVVSASESFSGPLPKPQHLAEYEAVVPGAAERIIRLAERKVELTEIEQSHRHGQEDKASRHGRWYTSAGLIFGFSISLLVLVGAIWALVVSNTVAIGLFLGTAATGIVTGLVRGAFFNGPPEQQDD